MKLSRIKTQSPSISLYLNILKRVQHSKAFRVQLKDLVKSQSEQFNTKQEKKQFQQTVDKIQQFLDTSVFHGGTKGIALFANAQEKLWIACESPHQFRTNLYVNNSFFIHPLLHFYDEYERFIGCILDHKQAKYFLILNGQIHKKQTLIDDKHSGRHHMGGWSQGRYQRHNIDHVLKHLKRAAKLLRSIVKEYEINRIIIGGTLQTQNLFYEHLSEQMKHKIIGTFQTEIFQTDTEFLNSFFAVEQQYERKQEKEKIKKLKEAGTRGAYGFKKVLEAYNTGLIQELLIDYTSTYQGLFCKKCSYISPKDLKKQNSCPRCSDKFTILNDVAPYLIKGVFLLGGSVEFIENKKDLIPIQGIGALIKQYS